MKCFSRSNTYDFKRKMKSRMFSIWVFFVAMVFSVCLVPGEGAADIVSDYTAYVQDYTELDQQCKHHLRGPDGKAMFNFENCRWRKDQILMRKYGLYDVLYDSGYGRYKELFEAARAAAVGKIEGQRQWMETWAWSQADIEYDYEDVQWSIIQRVSR